MGITFLFVVVTVVEDQSSRVVVVVMGPVAYLQRMHNNKSAIYSRSSTMKRGDWLERLVQWLISRCHAPCSARACGVEGGGEGGIHQASCQRSKIQRKRYWEVQVHTSPISQDPSICCSCQSSSAHQCSIVPIPHTRPNVRFSSVTPLGQCLSDTTGSKNVNVPAAVSAYPMPLAWLRKSCYRANSAC